MNTTDQVFLVDRILKEDLAWSNIKKDIRAIKKDMRGINDYLHILYTKEEATGNVYSLKIFGVENVTSMICMWNLGIKKGEPVANIALDGHRTRFNLDERYYYNLVSAKFVEDRVLRVEDLGMLVTERMRNLLPYEASVVLSRDITRIHDVYSTFEDHPGDVEMYRVPIGVYSPLRFELEQTFGFGVLNMRELVNFERQMVEKRQRVSGARIRSVEKASRKRQRVMKSDLPYARTRSVENASQKCQKVMKFDLMRLFEKDDLSILKLVGKKDVRRRGDKENAHKVDLGESTYKLWPVVVGDHTYTCMESKDSKCRFYVRTY